MNPTRRLVRKSRSLLWLVLVFLTCVVNADVVESAAPRAAVPDKGSLKARVTQLHKAIQDRSHEALRELVLPELLRCEEELEDGLLAAWDGENGPQLVSWKIRSIRYDGSVLGEELCSGEVLHATAGAIVEVVQNVQEPGHPIEKNELGLDWVYVDGVWFFVSVEC